MSNTDNNLLSFLKNQSLFNQSPNRRMSSRSRDRKSDRNRSSPAHNQQLQGNYSYNTTQGYNGNVQGNNYQDVNRGSGQYQTSYQTTSNNYQGGVQGSVNGGVQIQGGVQGGLQGGQSQSYQVNNNFTGQQLNGGAQIQTTTTNQYVSNELSSSTGNNGNLVTYSSSFESARVETYNRLESWATKVRTAINNLNYKLEMFNSQLLTVVTAEYNRIKERIYICVEETFRESEAYVR